MLVKLAVDLKLSEPPPLVADRRKCKLCSWRGVCNAAASAEGHLSEVSGIGTRRRQMLQELGILGLQELAAADPNELGSRLQHFGEQHGEVACELVAQARAQRDGRCERLDFASALPELATAPGVLLYDIESDPDARDDFLHGFVLLGRRPDGSWDLEGAQYHPFWCFMSTARHVAGSGATHAEELSRLASDALWRNGVSGSSPYGSTAGS